MPKSRIPPKPLTELVRMRYCPVRWDVGMRYRDRDFLADVCEKIKDLTFVRDLKDLQTKLAIATAWGATLLEELAPEP